MARSKNKEKARRTEPAPAPATAVLPRAVAVFAVAAGLFILAFGLYAQSRSFEFVNYDDYHYVVENTHVNGGLTGTAVRWALTGFAAGNWHPLTWISHMLDCEIFGLAPGGHHLTNALLHGANAALVFLVLLALTGSFWPSVFVAALFAAHPLNVESVAWVSERKNVLSTLFWLLAMGAYARHARQPSARRMAVVAVMLALGLAAKPMVVTLPCVLLLLDWWPLGRWSPDLPDAGGRAVSLVREKLPLFGLVVVASALTVAAQKGAGAMTTLDQVPLRYRLTNAAVAYLAYLWKTAWPTHLSAFYPHPGPRLTWATAGAALLLLAGVSALAWKARRAAPYVPVGWLWYVGTLVPVIGIVQVGSQSMADRYAYVPLLGIFMILAWGAAALAPRALAVTGACALVALAATTYVQVGYWANSIALFEHARDATALNYVAHTNLGLAYNKQKRWEEAIASFRRALKIQPRSAEALGHMGLALARTGRVDDAIAALSQAIEIYPDSEHAHNNLGVALRKRKPAEAVTHLRRAIALAPDLAEAHVNLGAALFELGREAEARQAFEGALALGPRAAPTRFRIGSVLLERGLLDEAAAHFRAALAVDPRHADAHNSLGVVLLRKGDLDAALPEFDQALALEPDDADAHSNRGTVLLRKGKTAEAQEELAAALRLNPRQADAHATLGAALARGGKLDEAVDHFTRAVEADPDNAVAQNNLGAALLQKGDLDGARQRLERALRLNATSADAHSNLGIVLLQIGDRAGAIAHLQAALKAVPNHANAQRYLEIALGRQAG